MNETALNAGADIVAKDKVILPVKKNSSDSLKEKKVPKEEPGDKQSTAISAIDTEIKPILKAVAAKPAITDLNNTVKEKKKNIKKSDVVKKLVISFQLHFHTTYGESLFITGNHELLGNNDLDKALPMQYFNEENWTAVLEIPTDTISENEIVYNYVFRNQDGTVEVDWGQDKRLNLNAITREQLFISDTWNHAGNFENAFYTEPFRNVLLKNNFTEVPTTTPKNTTHIFKIKAPLLEKGQTIFILGSTKEMGGWNESKAILLGRKEDDDWFTIKLDLSKAHFPLVYKYGVAEVSTRKIIRYEGGNNRFLYDSVGDNKLSIINDGLAILPANTWKGAGLAIPVFSLRSADSWGIGEFTDMQLLTQWAVRTGLKLIQILPINDSTANHTWLDSYPYAAISAFALHPMYCNPAKMADNENLSLLNDFLETKEKLNALEAVDYEGVNKLKWQITDLLYPLQKKATFESESYKKFYAENEHWLVPYATFCHLRDKYTTPDFTAWPDHKTYIREASNQILENSFDDLGIHFFVQYHLHLQLKEATQYAHENGIIVKGDIAIGVYRFGADAWQQPELYHMEMQAGAPPDDFAVKGQNWGFPTYNWQKMQENGFAWWKQRFEQMSNYFDAFRIDHILGFFRIWSIPINSVEGIMGYFVPDIPVHINEFNEKGIWFDYKRYCSTFINDQVLGELAGIHTEALKNTFLNYDGFGQFQLKPEFATQRQVEEYFAFAEDNSTNRFLKQCLFDLISNVILFPVENSQGQQFRFRFGMQGTSSFRNLDGGTGNQLEELYVNYFFRRQDNFWMKEAMKKLPALKRVTNMLVCGEDLGMVPDCVPDAMKQLGILSLEIQRMPKQTEREFFHPNDAPYMSVVTPSTHDMSTIRGWWEEDRTKTQRFFNTEMGQWGDAPYFCEDWVNRAIILQHLYSPAMWSVFQLQDLLGIDKSVRREDPHEERINVPSNPKNYWQYRMHISLENLLKEDAYNTTLSGYIKAAGRG